MKFRSLAALMLAVIMLLSACAKETEKTNETAVTTETVEELAEPTPEITEKGVVYQSDSCKITADMLQFIFFYDFYNTYGQYTEQYSLNIDLTFEEQLCNAADTEGVTWQEQLTDNTIEDVEDAIIYIEAAAANGYTYSTVTSSIQSIFDKWESSGMGLGLELDGYIRAFYGNNITRDIAEKSLQVIFCATEYRDHLASDYMETVTDEDYDNYYAENRLDFDIIDLIEYQMPINFNGVINEDRVKDILASESEEEFKSKVAENIRYFNSQLTNPKTEEALAISIEENTKTVKSYYTQGGEISEWGFAAEREVGDTFYTEKNDGMYHIYYLQKTAYPFVKDTANFLHMYCSVENYGSAEAAKAKAEELYAQWQAGEMTRESFEEMAKVNNDDPTYYYEDALKEYMTGDFKTWLFEEERNVGDTVVTTTEYGGYHVVYYLGKGMPEWKIDVKERLITEFTEETVASLTEELGSLSDLDYDYFDSLPNILPEGARDYTTSNYAY